MTAFVESEVERASLIWLENLGYEAASGPTIAPGEPSAERDSFDQVVLLVGCVRHSPA